MAFKLTYHDGQEDDYDDNTAWTVEDGVLKMGREAGKWTVLVSPSHWATIELQPGQSETADKDTGDKEEDFGHDEGKASADSQDKDESKADNG